MAPAPFTPPGAPLLRLRDVAVVHEGADAAAPAGVSLDVGPGEVVLILGPSGSGKSTLALTLNGLIPHSLPAEVSGSVEVAGVDAGSTAVSVLSRHVAMVFQDPDAQLVTGTVLDEVAFGPENLLVRAPEVLARAEDALRRVGLWERRADNPDHLSGGARQRLTIAAALAMDSPVLVLDEPTANLDPAGIDDVYATLAEVVARGDRAIVLIEHNLDAALALVDRVVVLDAAGRLLADGPAAMLRERAAELHGLGVWLPAATLAALRLRRAGYALDPLPLTPGELRAALERTPDPAAAPAASAAPAAASAATTASAASASASAPSAAERGRIGPMQHEPARGAPHPADSPGVVKSSPPLVRVRGLTMTRGRGAERRTVLEDVSLDIAPGDFVAVVGENGAGKTTLVQALAGVRRPPRGAVMLDGVDVARASPRELVSHVGFVFQNPEHQFIAGTVFDEIAHGLRMQRLPDDVVERKTTELLDRFGLGRHAHVHPFLLSGGQKRRLSVGTALVGGAPLLVLDEPTFGQDRARADELLTLLDDLRREGTTIVVVTHDMQLVAEHADRTVVISGGRLIAAAPTADVLGDEGLLRRAGLRPTPLRLALGGLASHPELARISRLTDLPGGVT
ncbi:ABC transporter ATP-binding protein [Microbacterium sp. RD1]|uniref:ABC transporter ATP-binding protein n=1 Tax=Microbacterium sp. RD1 TaxID=3457313 RepID=UPI003FA5B1E9